MTPIGHPDDVELHDAGRRLTDGNRRTMSPAGVVNQRYLIVLKGNYQELEITLERWSCFGADREVPRGRRKTWYTLKSRVDVAPDGSGVIRAKVWKRGDAEPEAWTIEVKHSDTHTRRAHRESTASRRRAASASISTTSR